MFEVSHIISDKYQRESEQLQRQANYKKSRMDFVKPSTVYDGSFENTNDFIYGKESKLTSKLQGPFNLFGHQIKKQTSVPIKPLTKFEEPAHYSEFSSKLDYLLEKVTDFAKSSEDISMNKSMRNEYQNVLRDKTLNVLQQNHPCSEKNVNEEAAQFLHGTKQFRASHFTNDGVPSFRANYLHEIESINHNYYDKNKEQRLNPQHLPRGMDNEHPSPSEQMVPPILNYNLRYIRVNSKDKSKTMDSSNLKKDIVQSNQRENQMPKKYYSRFHECKIDKSSSFEVMSENLKESCYMVGTNSVNEVEHERFRVIISGHLTTRDSPVFIIHKNDIGSSTLIKDSLDFRTFKKEGNVDVCLAGKFFNETILIENNKGSPSALDLKSHKLLIDSKSTVTQERFKHVINLGLHDAVLEGEFVENSETLQYIPIFSLEIVKHKPCSEINLNASTTSFGANAKNTITNSEEETSELTNEQEILKTPLSSENPAYSLNNVNDNNFVSGETSARLKKTKEKSQDSKFTKLKKNSFLRFFFKSKGNSNGNFQGARSSKNSSFNRNTQENEKDVAISMTNEINTKHKYLREKEKNNDDKKRSQNVTLEIHEINSARDTCSTPRKVSTGEKTLGFKDNITEKKSLKKRQSKHSKIVENPGVSQMQAFFLQT